MVGTYAAKHAAAAKIQALVRGIKDRKKVEILISKIIEEMMGGKAAAQPATQEPKPPPPPPPPPKPATGGLSPQQRIKFGMDLTKQASDQYEYDNPADDSIIDEEVIVIEVDTDNEYSSRHERVVEIVEYIDDDEDPSPPTSSRPSPSQKPKTAFELYNEQLKKPVARRASVTKPAARRASATKQAIPEEPPATSGGEKPESGKGGWWALKNSNHSTGSVQDEKPQENTTASTSSPAAAPQQSDPPASEEKDASTLSPQKTKASRRRSSKKIQKSNYTGSV